MRGCRLPNDRGTFIARPVFLTAGRSSETRELGVVEVFLQFLSIVRAADRSSSPANILMRSVEDDDVHLNITGHPPEKSLRQRKPRRNAGRFAVIRRTQVRTSGNSCRGGSRTVNGSARYTYYWEPVSALPTSCGR